MMRTGPSRSPHRAWTWHRCCLAAPVLLLALPAARAWLEASMWRQMILQLPLLVAAGTLLRGLAGPLPAAARYDAHGLTGLCLASFAGAYWMIPRALEASLTTPAAEFAKFASMLLLGSMLPGSLRRAALIIQVFFLANLCAMLAIAGMLYEESRQRLCNAYLLDDQALTGQALVVAASGLALAWAWMQRHALVAALLAD